MTNPGEGATRAVLTWQDGGVRSFPLGGDPMSQGDPELWKKAYRAQFDSDPDEDMAEHADDVEEWRVNWQAAYDAGEEWARNMVSEG